MISKFSLVLIFIHMSALITFSDVVSVPSLPDITQEMGFSESKVKKISPTTYQVGEVIVESLSREIRFAGKINMATGLIEVVVATEYGKLHESIISTTIDPMDLNVALLLLGLKDGSNPGWYVPDNPKHRSEGWDRPPGDMLDIFVNWEWVGEKHEVRVEELLWDIRKDPISPYPGFFSATETLQIETPGKSIFPNTHWVFVGSLIDGQGNFLARQVGSIITNYHDRSALIDLPLESGRIDDFSYANYLVIPPPGTPVEIRIVPVPKSHEFPPFTREGKRGVEWMKKPPLTPPYKGGEQ